MADVPIYVAIITAGAGVIGAAIPQLAAVIRDRRAERDRRERTVTRLREACIAVLSAADELRTLAENLPVYRGNADGMRARAEEARSLAKTTRLHVADVTMQASGLIVPADEVANAASNLADEVVRNINLNQGLLLGNPDVTKLVECIAAFRQDAVKHTGQLAHARPLPCLWPASCSATSR